MAGQHCLAIEPQDIVFNDVELQQTYRQTVTFTNTLASVAEVTVRPGSQDRFSISPSTFRLKPSESIKVELKLRVLRFARTPKTEQNGQRDIFHVKSPFFDQKFYTTFFLAPEGSETQQLRLSQGRGRGSRQSSPMPSPRSRRSPSPAGSMPGSPVSRRGSAPSSPRMALGHPTETRAGTGAREASERIASLERALQSQENALQAKDSLLQQLQAQLRLAEDYQAERGPQEGHGTSARDLRAENEELQQRIQDLDLDYRGLSVQLTAATRLIEELHQQNPDVKSAISDAVAGERAAQEIRNHKVLELLAQKDETIARMEARYAGLEGEAMQLRAEADGLNSQLADRQDEIDRLKEAHGDLLTRLGEAAERQEAAEAARDAQASLTEVGDFALRGAVQDGLTAQGSAASLAQEVAKLSSECDSLRQQLQEAHRHGESRSALLESSQLRINTLEAQLGALAFDAQPGDISAVVMAHDQEVLSLRSRMEELEKQLMEADSSGGTFAVAAPSNEVLALRVAELEDANERMETALLRASEGLSPREAGHPATDQLQPIRELKLALLEKDRRLGELEAQLALAGGRADGAMRDAETGELHLRRDLAVARAELQQRDASLAAANERLAELEAIHRGARDTALRTEHTLEELQRAHSDAQQSGQAESQEAKAAMATSARLSARISELTLQEQEARLEADGLKEQLRTAREDHLRDLEEFEKRQHQMRSALESMSTSTGRRQGNPGRPPLGPSLPHEPSGPSRHGLEEALRKATADAETSLSSVADQLAEAQEEARRAREETEQCQASSAVEAQRLRDELSAAKEQAAAELHELQVQVAALSTGTDLGEEVARLSGEVASLLRSEARCRSDLSFAEARAESLQRKLDDVQAAPAAASPPPRHRQSDAGAEREKGYIQELAAKMAARAEAAELEAGRLRMELQAAQASSASALAAAPEASHSPSPAAEGSVDEQIAGLQRLLTLREVDLSSAVAERVAALAEVDALRAKLVDSTKEVAAVQARLADCERQLYDHGEAASRRALASSSGFSVELSQLSQKASQAERTAQTNLAAKVRAESALQSSESELVRVKANLEACQEELKMQAQRASEEVAKAKAAAASSRREADASAAELLERQAHINILMDTVETLQAGNPGEKEQRVITLTAQLASARGTDAGQQRRTNELQSLVESLTSEVSRLEADAAGAHQEGQRAATEVAVLKKRLAAVEKEANLAQEELRAADSTLRQLESDIEAEREGRRRTAAELEGARETLSAAAARYMEQQAKERADNAVMLRQAKADSLRMALDTSSQQPAGSRGQKRPHADVNPELMRGMQEVLDWVRKGPAPRAAERHGQQRAAVGAPEHLAAEALEKMKALLAEAERGRSAAETEARIAAGEALALRARLKTIEGAFERRTVEWEAAENAKAAAERMSARQGDRKFLHAEQRDQLQRQRIVVLTQELQEANAHMTKMELEHIQAVAEAQQARQDSAALERQLAVAEANAKGSAAAAQAAALASEESLAARDSALRQYFESSVQRVLQSAGDSSDHVMGLTRELCALKLVESQLATQLEASRIHAASLAAGSSSLRRALANAEARLVEATSHLSATPGQGAAPAESREAVSRTAREKFEAEAKLLTAEQDLAAMDLDLREALARSRSAEAAASQAREERLGELERLREEMALQHAAQLHEMEARHASAVDAQASELEAIRARLSDERQQRSTDIQAEVESALHSRPTFDELSEARQRAASADTRAARLQRELNDAQSLLGALQGQLSEKEAALAEARDNEETHAEAIADLEASLSKMERAAEPRGRSVSAPRRSMSPSPSRKGRKGTAASQEGTEASGVVARELVHVRLAEADAQRKLRVSAREQLGLRQQLQARNARVQELKEALEGKSKVIDDLRRKLEQRRATAGTRGRGRGSAGRKTTPDRNSPAAAIGLPVPDEPDSPDSVPPEWAVDHADVALLTSGDDGASAAYAEVSSRGGPGLVGQISALKLELSRREGEVKRLEARLLEAVSASGGVDREELDLLRSEAETAVTSASLALGHQPAGVVEAVKELADRWRNSAVRRSRSSIAEVEGAITSTTLALVPKESLQEAQVAPRAPPAQLHSVKQPSSSLEVSQRSVIRSLSLRSSESNAQAAEARAEVDRLRSRLAALRSSVGSSSASGLSLMVAQEDETPGAGGTRDPQAFLEGLAANATGDAAAAMGIAELLGHHSSALKSSADALGKITDDGLAGNCGPEVREAARSMAVEVSSLDAALEVLVGELVVLSKKLEARPDAESFSAAAATTATGMQEAVLETWRQRAQAAEARVRDLHRDLPAADELRREINEWQQKAEGAEKEARELQSSLRGLRQRCRDLEARLESAKSPERLTALLPVTVPEASGSHIKTNTQASRDQPGSFSPPAADVTFQVDASGELDGSEHPTPLSRNVILAGQEGPPGEVAMLRLKKAKWKQRCQELRQELLKLSNEASAAEAAIKERMVATEQSLQEEKRKHGAELNKLKEKLKAAQQQGKESQEYIRESRDALANAEQRAIDSKRQASKLQEKLAVAEASSASRAQAVETLAKELNRSPAAGKTPGRSPLQLKQTNTPSAEAARISALSAELQSTMGRAQQAERQLHEAQGMLRAVEGELRGLKHKSAGMKSSHKEEVSQLRRELEAERAERVELVTAMRDSLDNLRQASDTQAKLKQQVASLQEKEEKLRAAEAAASTLANERKAALQHAVSDVHHLKSSLDTAEDKISEREARISSLTAAVAKLEVGIAEGNVAVDELHSKVAHRMEAAFGRLEEISSGHGTRLEVEIDNIDRELEAMGTKCQRLEDRLQTLAEERKGMEEERGAMGQLNRELMENNQLLGEQHRNEVHKLTDQAYQKQMALQQKVTEATQRAELAEAELEAMRTQLDAARTIGEEERQALVSHSLSEMHEVEARYRKEKEVTEARLERLKRTHANETELLRQSHQRKLEEAVEEAAERVDGMVREELTQEIKRRDKAYQEELRTSEADRDATEQTLRETQSAFQELQEEFNAYQTQKAQEIAALEARVRFLIAPRDATEDSEASDIAGEPKSPGREATKKSKKKAKGKGSVPIQLPVGIAIPSTTTARAEGAAQFDSGSDTEDQDDSEEGDGAAAGMDAMLQALMKEAEQSHEMLKAMRGLAPEGPLHGPEIQVGGALGASHAAAAAVNALREKEQFLAMAREIELERLQNEAVVQKLQRVIKGLHKVTGRLKKQISAQRVTAKAKERNIRRELDLHQQRLAQMHSPEELKQMAAKIQELQVVNTKSKSEISRLKQHIKAIQLSGKTDLASKLSAELSSERAAREAAESKLSGSKAAMSRKEAVLNDLKAKVTDLQQQLQKDDRFQLIDRAVNAEARLKSATSSLARKEAQIRALQERLSEAGKAEASKEQQEADREEKLSTKLRVELKRRENEMRILQADLETAHQALELAAQGAQEAAETEYARLHALDRKVALHKQVAADLLSAVRSLSRAALRASSSMRSAAALTRGGGDGPGSLRTTPVRTLAETQRGLGDGLMGRTGFAHSLPGETADDETLRTVSTALEQIEAALAAAADMSIESSIGEEGGWDPKLVRVVLEALESELRVAETAVTVAVKGLTEAQQSRATVAGAAATTQAQTTAPFLYNPSFAHSPVQQLSLEDELEMASNQAEAQLNNRRG